MLWPFPGKQPVPTCFCCVLPSAVPQGQVTVLPKGISKHQCTQISGFVPFYTASPSTHAPAEPDFERFYRRLPCFLVGEEKIQASSALLSHCRCIRINELLLLFIFLIKIKSLPLAQILPSD